MAYEKVLKTEGENQWVNNVQVCIIRCESHDRFGRPRWWEALGCGFGSLRIAADRCGTHLSA